jgi:hypothetical protein
MFGLLRWIGGSVDRWISDFIRGPDKGHAVVEKEHD